MRDSKKRLFLRKKAVRKKIFGTETRPRLSVYRGHKHLYAQLINDEKSNTLACASTLSPELKGKFKSADTIAAAQSVGALVGKKALDKGLKNIVFDRSGYVYHGRIKALAEAVKKAGLQF